MRRYNDELLPRTRFVADSRAVWSRWILCEDLSVLFDDALAGGCSAGLVCWRFEVFLFCLWQRRDFLGEVAFRAGLSDYQHVLRARRLCERSGSVVFGFSGAGASACSCWDGSGVGDWVVLVAAARAHLLGGLWRVSNGLCDERGLRPAVFGIVTGKQIGRAHV